VVMPAHSTTGDGVLTGLHLLSRVASTGKTLAELAAVVTKLPQVLINVPVADRAAAAEATGVTEAVSAAMSELNGSGRVLLRPSGTEQLVRVMVEAPTAELAGAVAERIAEAVRSASPA
jgi:phosphoglucosamine mutase